MSCINQVVEKTRLRRKNSARLSVSLPI